MWPPAFKPQSSNCHRLLRSVHCFTNSSPIFRRIYNPDYIQLSPNLSMFLFNHILDLDVPSFDVRIDNADGFSNMSSFQTLQHFVYCPRRPHLSPVWSCFFHVNLPAIIRRRYGDDTNKSSLSQPDLSRKCCCLPQGRLSSSYLSRIGSPSRPVLLSSASLLVLRLS